MTMPQFNCDREWWSTLTEEEQDRWLDFAESCGAPREPFLVDRNPDYPDLVCMPCVTVDIDDDELIELLP